MFTVIASLNLACELTGRRWSLRLRWFRPPRADHDRRREFEQRVALLESQMEASRDGLLLLDVDAETSLCNRRFLELWHFPASAVDGWRDGGLPALIADKLEDPAAFEAGVDKLLSNSTAVHRDDLRLNDGRIFERYGSPLIGADGRQLGWLWSFSDVSDRKAAENRLVFQGRVTRAITDNAKGCLFMTDQAGRATFMNPAAVTVTGFTLAEIRDRPLHDVLHGPAHAREALSECALKRALERGAPMRDYEATFSRRDGTTLLVSCTVAPLVGDRGNDGAVVDFQDISELKRTERLLTEADRRKNEFLAMLAHELRNPLGPILHAAEIVARLAPREDALQEASGAIQRQVAHMTRLVDDLLDVSRISHGKILLHTEALDLVGLARAAAEDMRGSLEASALELELDLPDAPVTVRGDATRLGQVVGNLLSNALKFSQSGGRVVLAIERDGERAVITVRDTGIGIAPEVLRRLFEPFSQADSGLARSRGGLGLGLAVVKGLVELHGGTVRAASPGEGRGSTFIVSLPLTRGELRKPTPVVSRPTGSRPRTVLIVEDNRSAAQLLQTGLRLLGHEALVSTDGAEALELARRQPPDLVLCDIGLPGGMDGYAIARTFRADSRLAGARLVALTGYGGADDRRSALDAGFDEHLTKPISLAAIDELLGSLPVD